MSFKRSDKRYMFEYYKNNKEALDQYRKLWGSKHKERIKKQARERIRKYRASSPIQRMKDSLRSRLSRILKLRNKGKFVSHVRNLGCTIPEFLTYLESKFKPGMTFENYGKVWQLDHIIPLAALDLSTKEDQLKAIHFTNIQPLFIKDNIVKKDKLPEVLPEIKLDPNWKPEIPGPSLEVCRKGGLANIATCLKNNLNRRKPLRAENIKTKEIRFYLSACHASKDLDLSRGTIAGVARPTCRFKSTGGWIFTYVDKSKINF